MPLPKKNTIWLNRYSAIFTLTFETLFIGSCLNGTEVAGVTCCTIRWAISRPNNLRRKQYLSFHNETLKDYSILCILLSANALLPAKRTKTHTQWAFPFVFVYEHLFVQFAICNFNIIAAVKWVVAFLLGILFASFFFVVFVSLLHFNQLWHSKQIWRQWYVLSMLYFYSYFSENKIYT